MIQNIFIGLLSVVIFCFPAEKVEKLCNNEVQDSIGTELAKFDLKPGDLLVRPNKNFLPGSSKVDGGRVAGHAAIVIEGAEGSDISEVLSKALVVEAALFDQPTRKFITERSKQIRISTAETSFGKKYEGIRYRLRIPMNEMQRERIVNRAKDFTGKGKYSIILTKSQLNKRIENPNRIINQPGFGWNCTALVWYLCKSVLGVDIDSNEGEFIYPNDVLNSPIFVLPDGLIKF